MTVFVSVIIPAYNAGRYLPKCLDALCRSLHAPFEIIVVDDGSTDDTKEIAQAYSALVMPSGGRKGPAFARNIGAKAARGDVLLFIDSDVCVTPETLSRIVEGFESDPELDALIGSYDSAPYSPDFLSQYRNLMHHYVHHTGCEQASTFWSGCGAIRTKVFREHSGFDEDYERPAIEDIELGYRLIRAGRKILLDRRILVTHLKHWTFWGLVKTDILDRGIPWTELILRDRFMPNDLNLQLSQRVSVALVFVLIGLSGAMAFVSGAYALLPLFVIAFLMLARWWGELGNYKRPRRAYAMLLGVIAVIVGFAYWFKMYGLILPLLVSPVLLLLRHRYRKHGMLRNSHRWLALLYICCSVAVAVWYLPAHRLAFPFFAVIVLLGIMNSQFYIFLAGHRSPAFMLAAIPFHLLYHFYNGVSFAIGFGRHLWSAKVQRTRTVSPPAP